MNIQCSKVGRCVAGLVCCVLGSLPVQAQSATTTLPEAREGTTHSTPLSGYFDSRRGGESEYKYSDQSQSLTKFGWLQLDRDSGRLTGTPARVHLSSLRETLTFSVTRTVSGTTQPVQTERFRIELYHLNNRPRSSSVPLANASVHARLQYSLEISKFFTDPDISLGDVLTYRADVTRPWGISLSTIGLRVLSRSVYDEGAERYVKKYFIEGIPTRLGSHRIRLGATDLAGASAYRYYTLTVKRHPSDTTVFVERFWRKGVNPDDEGAEVSVRIDLPYVEVTRDYTEHYSKHKCGAAILESYASELVNGTRVYPDWTRVGGDWLDSSVCLPTGQDSTVPVFAPSQLLNIPYLRYVDIRDEGNALERVSVLCLDVTFHAPIDGNLTNWELVSAPDADDAGQCALRRGFVHHNFG